MQWLSDLPFADNRVVQIGFLAACGIAALVVLAILYRFVFAHRLRVPGGRTRQPRLGLVDAFSLDGQRQLVLVRRDNVEHLIMIGGPNDVLVESQINRALAATRETNLAPAAHAPPAPAAQAPLALARRAEPAAKAPAPQPAQAAPAAQVVAAEVRPIRPRAVSPAPAPSAPESSPPPIVTAAESVHEPASAPVPAKALEPAVAAQGRPQPRPLPARPAMPSPITPGGAPVGRASVTRFPEKQAASAPAADAAVGPNPGLGEPAVPLQGRPPRSAPAVVAPATPAHIPPSPSAPVVQATPAHIPPAASVKAAGTEAPMFVKAELKIGHPQPPAAEPLPPSDRRPAAPVANGSSSDKPAPKTEDPFGGLESLEAEMARLLGRESP
jgi:flagellar protein FliO/FliZ